jgi:hypothetical protein
MSTGWLSIPAEVLGRTALTADQPGDGPQKAAPHAVPHGASEPAELHAQWRDAAGEPLGPPIPLGPVYETMLEHPGDEGQILRSQIATSPVVPDEPPEGATALSVHSGADRLGVVQKSAMRHSLGALGAPRKARIGPAGAKVAIAVIGERFPDWDAFFAWGSALYAWVVAKAPFNSLPQAVAFDLFFWPSDVANGLFGTDDSQCRPNRLFYGDREVARRLLAPYIGGFSQSVILINSRLRGGAGGQPGWSAWASVTGAPGEPWQGIVLHEVGHGFGLADEYVDPQHAGDPLPPVLEPNVASDPRPSHAPWAHLAVGDTPTPTGGLDGGGPAGVVGTFQGARYRPNFYRPTLTCLMKDTRQPFCLVCQKHIERYVAEA